jgi:hypothetical protein
MVSVMRGMINFLKLFSRLLASPFKKQARLEAEIVLPRHQLNVLRQRFPSKPRLSAGDRFLSGSIACCVHRKTPSLMIGQLDNSN